MLRRFFCSPLSFHNGFTTLFLKIALWTLRGDHGAGLVATSHYLASGRSAGAVPGGSAMDAAIAANAVLGVTEPI